MTKFEVFLISVAIGAAAVHLYQHIQKKLRRRAIINNFVDVLHFITEETRTFYEERKNIEKQREEKEMSEDESEN